jgi:hypothetical protein
MFTSAAAEILGTLAVAVVPGIFTSVAAEIPGTPVVVVAPEVFPPRMQKFLAAVVPAVVVVAVDIVE